MHPTVKNPIHLKKNQSEMQTSKKLKFELPGEDVIVHKRFRSQAVRLARGESPCFERKISILKRNEQRFLDDSKNKREQN